MNRDWLASMKHARELEAELLLNPSSVAVHRTYELHSRALDTNARTIRAIITTETPVLEYDYKRDDYVERVLLISGAIFPRNMQVPLLNCHDRSTAKSILGSARSLAKESEGVVSTLHFASCCDAEWQMVRDGHVTDVSAGFRVLEEEYIEYGEAATFDGRTFTGPINIATSWQLFEVSLVPIGADENAKIGIGRGRNDRANRSLLNPFARRVFALTNQVYGRSPRVVSEVVDSLRACANILDQFTAPTEPQANEIPEEEMKGIVHQLLDEYEASESLPPFIES